MSNLPSFADLVEQHALSIRAARMAKATVEWYESNLRLFNDWRVAHGLPDQLPPEADIEAYMADLHAKGLSPSTVHARYRSIARVFNWAEKRRLIERASNPFHLVTAPRLPRVRPRHVTHDDLQALLNTILGDSWLEHRDRVILMLLFYSGLRLSELCALHVADIDLKRGEVFVQRGKGAKPRMVPTTPALGKSLLPYLYSRPSNRPELLLSGFSTSEKTRGLLTGEGLRMMLRRRSLAAGLPVLSAHKFRHGFAMWLRNNGTDLSDIAAAMGHSTTQVTQLYYAFTLAPAVHKAYNRAFDRLHEEGGTDE